MTIRTLYPDTALQLARDTLLAAHPGCSVLLYDYTDDRIYGTPVAFQEVYRQWQHSLVTAEAFASERKVRSRLKTFRMWTSRGNLTAWVESDHPSVDWQYKLMVVFDDPDTAPWD